MNIYILVTVFGFIIFILFLILLIRAVQTDQYEDLVTPPERALWEDRPDES